MTLPTAQRVIAPHLKVAAKFAEQHSRSRGSLRGLREVTEDVVGST